MNWDAVAGAFSLLTILPFKPLERERGRIFAHFPFVGLVIGVILAMLAANEALAPPVRILTVLVAWIVITGGLHLDGVGDFCDGVLSTAPPQRRLEIMRDPQSGTWAVVGLVVVLLAKWALLQDITPFLLIVPPVLGRLAMVFAAYSFPYARGEGMGSLFREGLGRREVLVAIGQSVLFILPAILLFGSRPLLALVLTPVLVLVLGNWTASRLGGGLTGDVYGAMCELTEIMCLLCLTV